MFDTGPHRVLITGARAPVALELCRIFSAAGHRVYAADSLAHPVCRMSGAVNRCFRVPGPRFALQEFGEAIQRIVDEHQIDLVIPTCEEVFYLSFLAKDRSLPVFAPGFEMLRRLHHKGEFLKLAGDCGVSIPETNPVKGRMRGERRVFKPVYSRYGARVKIQPNQFEIPDSAGQEWIAQQFIEGTEWSSYSVAHEGKVLAHCSYRPMIRLGGGASVVFQAREHPGIEAFVERFVAKHRLTGQLGFDFIEENEGTLFVLECNPRATSGVHFLDSRLAGGFLGDSAAERVKPRKGQPAGKIGLPLAMLWWQGLANHKLGEIMAHGSEARDVIFHAKDVRPAWYQPFAFGEILLRSLLYRCTPVEASTRDLEWNGEELRLE